MDPASKILRLIKDRNTLHRKVTLVFILMVFSIASKAEEPSFFGIPLLDDGKPTPVADPKSAEETQIPLQESKKTREIANRYQTLRTRHFLRANLEYAKVLDRLLTESMERKNLDEANSINSELERLNSEIAALKEDKHLPALDEGKDTLKSPSADLLKAYGSQIFQKSKDVVNLNRLFLMEMKRLQKKYLEDDNQNEARAVGAFAHRLTEENNSLAALNENLKPLLDSEVTEYLSGKTWNVPKGRYPGTYEFLADKRVLRLTPKGKTSWEGYYEVLGPRVIRCIATKPKPPKGKGVRTISFSADFSRFTQDSFGIKADRVESDTEL